MSREDVFAPLAGTFYVGTSSIIGLTLVANQNYVQLKLLTVGNSGLFIGGSNMAVGLSAIANGYYSISNNEVMGLNLSDTLYFTSAGSTSQVTYIFGRSSAGSSLLGF